MATVIVEGLVLGDATEAATWHEKGHFVVNVLEAVPSTPHDAWIPILRAEGDELSADPAALDRVAHQIDGMMRTRRPVFLHCGQGIERSPLATAWFLWKTARAPSFEEAYSHVERLHPQTQRRDVWVPWAARNGTSPGVSPPR